LEHEKEKNKKLTKQVYEL